MSLERSKMDEEASHLQRDARTLDTQPPVVDSEATSGSSTSGKVEDEMEYPGGLSLTAIFIGLFLTVFCTGLDRTIVSTAVPKITAQFNSLDDVAWYASSYLIATCCTQLLFGKLYAEFDVKWVFLASMGLFEAGSIVCGAAPSSLALILGRAVSGVGVAGVVSGALIILARSVPVHNRPKFSGAIGGASGVATVIAPTLGGVFTDKLNWTWCFWINLPLGGVTFLVVLFLVKIPSDTKSVKGTGSIKEALGKFDLLGTTLLIPWVISLLLALQWGGSKYAWSSWRIVVLLVCFAVVSLVWLFVQFKQGDKATMPIRLIRQRSMAAGVVFTICTYGAFFVVVYYVAIWFQAVRGVSAYHSGIDFLAASAAMALSVFASGFLTTWIGYYVPNMIASTVVASIGTGLVYTFDRETSTGFWITALILTGFGIGLGIQQPFIATQTLFNGPDLALATSVLIFIQTLAGSVVLSIAQNIFQNQLLAQVRHLAPGVNPQDVVEAGASGLKEAIEAKYPQHLDAVLTAYSNSIRHVFLIPVVLTCLGVFGVAAMEWVSVRKTTDVKVEEAGEKLTAVASAAKHEKE